MTKKYNGIDAATVARLKDGVTNFTQEDARYYMRLHGTEALICLLYTSPSPRDS